MRWQVERDLLDAPRETFEATRQQVALEGWGAQLLALQDPEGTWGKGLYNPKWTSTTYTVLLLRDLGLPPHHPQLQRACTLLLDGGLTQDGGLNYGRTDRGETCITGMVLSLLAYSERNDPRLETVIDHLFQQQLEDGGWNCRSPHGATHSSVHTTLSVLEGLQLYTQFRGKEADPSRAQVNRLKAVQVALERGREFLRVHRLFRSHRTGNVMKSEFKRIVFPPRWHYDILRALDHFQAVNAPRDERLSEAIDIVRTRQGDDGRWTLEYAYAGKTHFVLERKGAPSRWNTLRALRVLRWWDAAGSQEVCR